MSMHTAQPKRKALQPAPTDGQKKARMLPPAKPVAAENRGGNQNSSSSAAAAASSANNTTPEYEARKVQVKALLLSFNQLDPNGRRLFAHWLNHNHPDFWLLQHDGGHGAGGVPPAGLSSASDDGAAAGAAAAASATVPATAPAVAATDSPSPSAQQQVFADHLPRIMDFVVGNCLDSMVLLLQASNVGLVNTTFHSSVEGFLQQSVTRVNLQRDLSLGASLTDDQLESLLSRTPALEYLQLRYCSALTSPGLARIVRRQYCPKLRVLQLGSRSTKKSMDRNCSHRFSAEVARAIAESCPALEELNVNLMNCCDDGAIQAMTINCPRLRKLHIGAQSSNLTDDAFCRLKPITNGDGDEDSHADEAGVLRQMEGLSLFGLRYLTDAGVERVARCLKGLTYLDLEACHNLSNSSLGVIARECTRLEQLFVGGLNVDDDAIVDLVTERSSTLHTLDLSECTNLTDKAIIAVANNLGARLRSIDLSFVHGFTDKSLEALGAHCPNLRHFVILGSTFSYAATTALLKRCGASLEDITVGTPTDDRSGTFSPPAGGVPACSGSGRCVLSSIASNCPGLRRLDFSGDVVSGDPAARVAKELNKLVRACRKLESLTLNACDLGDADMHFLANHGARHLHSLELFACNNLTEDCFSRAAPTAVTGCGGGGSEGGGRGEGAPSSSVPSSSVPVVAAGACVARFPELSYVKIVDCERLCGAGEVPTMLNLVRLCRGQKKLWISFCGEGTKSEVAAFVDNTKCKQFWMKTEKHFSGAHRHVVNVEVLPRQFISCAQVRELRKTKNSKPALSSSTSSSSSSSSSSSRT